MFAVWLALPAALAHWVADYESHKTTPKLHGLMRCFVMCLFIRGLWSHISGKLADAQIRTDANNLVGTASTTRQPEQKEAMHLIQMIRQESNSGQMHDLAHVRSENCLADCLRKSSAKAGELIKFIMTGILRHASSFQDNDSEQGVFWLNGWPTILILVLAFAPS